MYGTLDVCVGVQYTYIDKYSTVMYTDKFLTFKRKPYLTTAKRRDSLK